MILCEKLHEHKKNDKGGIVESLKIRKEKGIDFMISLGHESHSIIK